MKLSFLTVWSLAQYLTNYTTKYLTKKFNYFGEVWTAMGEVFIRPSQYPKLSSEPESLGQFWPLGLKFDSPDLG